MVEDGVLLRDKKEKFLFSFNILLLEKTIKTKN